MQLFKRVLLSLFPDEIITQSVNPASMFVSFISTKEFFSVINRKIVENYKLNLFDIALDPFEFKIGFWEKPSVKIKQLDLYYGYCGAANLNGYRFLNPANLANTVSLVVSTYVKDIFVKYDPVYYLHFLYTVYLLSFVFLARMKIFPGKTRQEDYNWFIDVFFEFYQFVFHQTNTKLAVRTFAELKKILIGQIDIFFMLFEFYQHLNTLFYNEDVTGEEFYAWIFADELNKNQYKILINDFIGNYSKYTVNTKFSMTEKKILTLVLPADILLRYMFMDSDMFLISDYVISKIYSKKKLDVFLAGFRKHEGDLEQFLLYLTDYKHFKKRFFPGVQKYVMNLFRDDDQKFEPEEEDVNEFMSSIWDDIENLESFKVPERLKKESKMMEKILNFYITLIGGFWTARGDSFFLRLFRRPLIQKCLSVSDPFDEKQDTLNFYWGLLYNYGKNVFYYKYASENVRAGKQKFFVPYKSNFKNVYSNMCILKLLDENFLATILQDINPRDIRIYVKSKQVLDIFKKKFGLRVSTLVKKSDDELVKAVYTPLASCLNSLSDLPKFVQQETNEKDLYNLKDNLYSLDFWMAHLAVQKFAKLDPKLQNYYSDLSIVGIFALLRETLFWFFLYMKFLYDEEKSQKKSFHLDLLKDIYINEVLWIADFYKFKIKKILDLLYEEFSDILEVWTLMDDNIPFMHIAFENWLIFIEWRTHEYVLKSIVGEDTIWFRGFLKNITYYNKRFLIP